MNKIKNISLLCACALLSAGSAVADPGPILSPDGTSFQLNFPPIIVDRLNEFIAGVEQNNGPHDIYAIELSDDGNKLLTSIDQEFPKTVGAMVPYIDLAWEEIQARLQEANVTRVYKTLLQLQDSHISIPANTAFAFCIKTILNYFFVQFIEHHLSVSCGDISFLMKRKVLGAETAQSIEDYICNLDEIIQSSLSKK